MTNAKKREITLEKLEESYEQFCEEANKIISSFFEGKYTAEAAEEINLETPLFRLDFVQTRLDEIKVAYAFIKMLNDIYSLEFIQLANDYGKQFNFEPRERPFEKTKLKFLAYDMVINYPKWDWKTFDRSDFRGIGFSRDESKEGVSISNVSYIPILGMKFEDKKTPAVIKPVSWGIIGRSLAFLSRISDF
jgi:hypothetical protein